MDKIIEISVDDSFYIIGMIVNDEGKKILPEDIYEPFKMRSYKYIDNKFIFDEDRYNELVELSKVRKTKKEIQNQINILKDELSKDDYKIIKCYEAQLVGEELPYNMEEVHAQREEIRQQINELEKELL